MKLITRIRLVKEDLIRERARKRVRRLPTHEVLLWGENSLSTVGRALSIHQRGGDLHSLLDAEQALQSLHGVVDELRSRADRGA